jgi:hypothetical protein
MPRYNENEIKFQEEVDYEKVHGSNDFDFNCWGYAVAQEVTYVDHIKPIMDAKCIRCHGPDSPEYEAFKAEKEKWLAQFKGPRMDTYSHLIFYTAWPDTGSLMRRLDDGKNTKDGKSE